MAGINLDAFADTRGRIFTVWTTWNKGLDFVLIYRGSSRETAETKTNFWDERGETYMTVHQLDMSPLAVGNRKLDRLADRISTMYL